MKTRFNFHPSTWIFLISLSTLLSFTSCEKPEEILPDDIIGNWTATDVTVGVTYNDVSAYDYYISQGVTEELAELTEGYQIRGYETYIPITMNFKADGVLETVSGAIGDTDGSHQEDTWLLSEDRKTLTFFDMDAAVLELTNNALSFQLVFDSTEYSEEMMTYSITLTYAK